MICRCAVGARFHDGGKLGSGPVTPEIAAKASASRKLAYRPHRPWKAATSTESHVGALPGRPGIVISVCLEISQCE